MCTWLSWCASGMYSPITPICYLSFLSVILISVFPAQFLVFLFACCRYISIPSAGLGWLGLCFWLSLLDSPVLTITLGWDRCLQRPAWMSRWSRTFHLQLPCVGFQLVSQVKVIPSVVSTQNPLPRDVWSLRMKFIVSNWPVLYFYLCRIYDEPKGKWKFNIVQQNPMGALSELVSRSSKSICQRGGDFESRHAHAQTAKLSWGQKSKRRRGKRGNNIDQRHLNHFF